MHISGGHWVPHDHILAIEDIMMAVLRDEYDRVIVEMPPQHGKTNYLSEKFVSWYLGTFPDEDVMLLTYGQQYANELGANVRDILRDYGPEVFGVYLHPKRQSSNNIRIAGHRGGLRTFGALGQVTGRGGKLMLIDDPHKGGEDLFSDRYRNRFKEWFRSKIITRLRKGGKLVILLTRWHEDDLAGWLQSEFPKENWKVLTMPALAYTEDELTEEELKNGYEDPLGREPGEALCPDLHPKDELERKFEVMGDYWASCEMQQRPISAKGSVFKVDWWKFWSTQEVGRVVFRQAVNKKGDDIATPRGVTTKLPERFSKIIQYWDMTYKNKPGSDYVVGELWGAAGPDRYLLDQVRGKWLFEEALEQFIGFCQTPWGKLSQEKYIELRANGPAIVSVASREIPGIIGIEPVGNSFSRAQAVTWMMKSGNVYIPDWKQPGYEWVRRDYLRELTQFPAGTHDDQVDCTSGGLMKLFPEDLSALEALLGVSAVSQLPATPLGGLTYLDEEEGLPGGVVAQLEALGG